MRQAAPRIPEEQPPREGLVPRPMARACLACSGHSKDKEVTEVTGAQPWQGLKEVLRGLL